MKKLIYGILGLFLAFVVITTIIANVYPVAAPTGAAAAAAAAPVVQADSAIEAVSPSAAFSRSLRGVYLHPVTCTPSHLRIGDSIDVEIKEAWLEKKWEPSSGGLFGENDWRKGYAIDSTSEFPRTQLVMAFTPTSRLGHFDNYSWQLNLASDTYKQHGFTRSRGNQLVMYFTRSNAVFPLKFNLLTCPKPGPLCEQQPVGTVTLTE